MTVRNAKKRGARSASRGGMDARELEELNAQRSSNYSIPTPYQIQQKNKTFVEETLQIKENDERGKRILKNILNAIPEGTILNDAREVRETYNKQLKDIVEKEIVNYTFMYYILNKNWNEVKIAINARKGSSFEHDFTTKLNKEFKVPLDIDQWIYLFGTKKFKIDEFPFKKNHGKDHVNITWFDMLKEDADFANQTYRGVGITKLVSNQPVFYRFGEQEQLSLLNPYIEKRLQKIHDEIHSAGMQGGNGKKAKPKQTTIKQKVHIGPKGGRYTMRNGRKVYI